MPRLRIIVLALLLVAWLPAANACLLAVVFPQQFEEPCDDCGLGGTTGDASCSECATLETGFCLSHLQPFAVTAPVLRADEWLTALLLVVRMPVAEKAPPDAETSPPLERSLWHFVARTALPVRGPSLV